MSLEHMNAYERSLREQAYQQEELRHKYSGLPVILGHATMPVQEYFELVSPGESKIVEPQEFVGKSVEELEAEQSGKNLELHERVGLDEKCLIPQFVNQSIKFGSSEEVVLERVEVIVKESKRANTALAEAEGIIYSLGQDL